MTGHLPQGKRQSIVSTFVGARLVSSDFIHGEYVHVRTVDILHERTYDFLKTLLSTTVLYTIRLWATFISTVGPQHDCAYCTYLISSNEKIATADALDSDPSLPATGASSKPTKSSLLISLTVAIKWLQMQKISWLRKHPFTSPVPEA